MRTKEDAVGSEDNLFWIGIFTFVSLLSDDEIRFESSFIFNYLYISIAELPTIRLKFTTILIITTRTSP